MNIQVSKKIVIDLFRRKLIVDNCFEFFAFIKITNQNKRVDRIARNRQQLSLSSMSIINVLMQIRDNSALSFDRNYMFHSKTSFNFKSKNDVFIHIVDANMSMMQIRNVITKAIIISRHAKLERVLNYEKKDCYLTLSNDAHLVVKSKKQVFKNSFKLVLVDLVTAVMYIDLIRQSPSSVITAEIATRNIFNVSHFTITAVSKTKPFLSIMKAIFPRGIIIYKNEVTRAKFEIIIDRFSEL